MGVSGCPNKCADSASVDLGLMGTTKGYHLYVGGNGGVKPRQGTLLLENIQKEQVLPVVAAVIAYYKENSKPHERLGRLLDRIGIEELHEFAEKAMH